MSPIQRGAYALVRDGSGVGSFDALRPELQAAVIKSVREIAANFREPTPEMIETGIGWLRGERDEEVIVTDIWRSMIDALVESE